MTALIPRMSRRFARQLPATLPNAISVGQAHARGDLTGAVDEQVGAPDEESESYDDEEELQKHVGLS